MVPQVVQGTPGWLCSWGWLFLACGWYGALGRVANFEMCHLRSLGRVANIKNEACRNGGIGFDFFEFLTCCTCYRMIIRGGWGWGVGGCINVLDEHFLYVTENAHVAHAVSCVKDYPHKRFESWPKSTANKISLLRLRLIIFEVVCGINPIEPLLLVLNKWMEHGSIWKNGDLRQCSTNKTTTCTKKGTLGPTAGHGVTTLPCCRLWLLRCHKRSGTASVEKREKLEEWTSPWYDSDDWKS